VRKKEDRTEGLGVKHSRGQRRQSTTQRKVGKISRKERTGTKGKVLGLSSHRGFQQIGANQRSDGCSKKKGGRTDAL